MSERGPKYGGINIFLSLRYSTSAYGCYLHFEGISKSPFVRTKVILETKIEGYPNDQISFTVKQDDEIRRGIGHDHFITNLTTAELQQFKFTIKIFA